MMKKSKLLRACILSMLTCTTLGSVSAEGVISSTAETIGGRYDIIERESFIAYNDNYNLKATEDVVIQNSEASGLDNKRKNQPIILGSFRGENKTVHIDMQGYNLTTGEFGNFIDVGDNGSKNSKVIIENAKNIKSTIKKDGHALKAVSPGTLIDLRAQENIELNSSSPNPILSIQDKRYLTDIAIYLKAGKTVAFNQIENGNNLINVKNGAYAKVEAGEDILFNNIEHPTNYLEAAHVDLNAGRDILYNSAGTHVWLENKSKMNVEANRNLTLLSARSSTNMINASQASVGRFSVDKRITLNALNLGQFPAIFAGANSLLTFDSEDFYSNVHRTILSRTNANIQIHVNNNIELHTEGFDIASTHPNFKRSMILAESNSNVILKADNKINFSIARGDTAVDSNSGGTTTLEAAHGINLVTGGTTDNPQEATVHTDNGFINLTSGDKPITLTNQGSIGAYATNEGLINFYSPTIAQTGEGAVAINKGTVNFQEAVDFTTTRKGATANDEGNVNFNKQAKIYTTGTGAVANTKGIVNFNDQVLIDGATTGATASDEGVVNFNKQAIINASDEGLVAINSGRINVKDDLYLPNSKTVMHAESNGVIDASSTQKTKQLPGNILAHGGTVLLNLDTADSYLTGYTRASDIAATETAEGSLAQLDVSLANGAIWNVTDHSSLTKLTNHSLVNLVDANHNGKSIITKELSGNGTMAMNLDWHTNQGAKAVSAHSDYIRATEKASGTQAIVTDKSLMHLEDMAVNDRLYFATLKNSEATFTSPITQRNVDKGHLYDYIIGINSEMIGDTTDWYFGSVASVESPLVGATAKAHDGLYDLALDIDTLNKRFGEARYVRYEEEPRKDPHGIWARATHMNLGHDTYNGHANRYEIGRDYLMEREDGAFVHRGGSFNYLRATTSYDGGSTKFKRYTGTLYHTWLGNKDHYLDLVGRVGKIHAKTKAYLVDGEQSKASFGTWYQQLSAEWGRRKALNEDWYFEPQVQLQYTHINSKTYTTNDGITNHLDHTNSLIGRLGFRLGHHIDEDTSWYFKADILHEFAGNRSFYLTSINGLERIHYDVTNHDTWYDIGLGINSEMSHNRSIWLEVERKFGGSYSKAWEINGGMTWRFE